MYVYYYVLIICKNQKMVSPKRIGIEEKKRQTETEKEGRRSINATARHWFKAVI